jgi:aryl-alcohol dehydrogenase
MEIRAAVTRARHAPLSLEAVSLESPRSKEVVVQVVASGICHTDLSMRDQVFPVPHPIVLGHEGAGIVVETGAAVDKLVVGDHVIMSFNSCGICPSCLAATPSYCHDFFGRNFAGARPDGSTALSQNGKPLAANFFGQSSFATFAICHERNAVKVPREVPLDVVAPLACGIQTGAGAVLNSLNIGAGQSFAVFGTGSVGLSAILAARVRGVGIIIAVDTIQARLDLAAEFGATHTINPRGENAVERIAAITGSGCDFSLDTTGQPLVIRHAVEALTFRGTCGILGAAPLGTEITLDAMHVMTAGRHIRGIVEGDSVPDAFIPVLVELYRQGRFPFDRMITFYNFDQINQAIDDSEQARCIKPVVRMPSV